MARRRRSYRSSYSRPRRSYSRSSRYPRRAAGRGQSIRLILQQPGMQAPRPAFGTFQPSQLFNAFMQPYVGQGAPFPWQGGPGVPGARMVINPVSPPGATPDAGGSIPTAAEAAAGAGRADPTAKR